MKNTPRDAFEPVGGGAGATRRNALKFAAGAAVGVLFTPAPWRLITDTALWSENWPGVPRPIRGEPRVKYTHCTLCPAGCGVRARCVGEQPVSLAGAGGGLCAFGVAAHHLPYHPRRVRQGKAKEAAAAVADAIARCAPSERVAVIDLRPGRTASWTYRRALAALPNGTYLAPAQPPYAVNLASARTVLSLGAPLLDGWCSPANAFAARERFHLIQAEPVETRTAALADEWLPIRPGSEEALARALAGTLPLPEAAEKTGLAQRQISELGRELKDNGPALAIAGGMPKWAVALNLAFGAWGTTLLPRAEAPVPAAWNKAAAARDLAGVPDRSIRVLMIDESVPGEPFEWDAIRGKLAEHPVVVAFSSFPEGYARYADFVLPAALYPETADDVATPADSPAPVFRVAAPLVPPAPGAVNPVEFVAAAAGFAAGDPLRERADAIHASGRGTLFTYADGRAQAVKDVKPDDFWKALNEGGEWAGDAAAKAPRPDAAAASGEPAVPESPLPLRLVVAETALAASPLASKLYRESGLRLAAGRVALHPSEARACDVEDGTRAWLVTEGGRREVEVTVDEGVRPGVVVVSAPPGFRAGHGKVVRA